MTAKLPGLRQSGINVLSMWGQRIGGTLVTLLITPIITNHFGLELVGVWLLVSQYAQHLMLLELGLNTSLTRFLARHRGSGDLLGASRYLSASIFSLLAMGALIVLLVPLLAEGFNAAFDLPPGTESQAYWLVLLASITVGLSLPLRAGIGMLSSVHRFDRLASWETVALAARLALVLVFFHWFDPDLLMLGLITFVPTLLANLMVFRDGRRRNRDLTIGYGLVSRQVLLDMFSISGASIVITFSAVAVRQSSPMLAGYALGADQVALLAFPILIVSAAMPFIGVANRLIAPVASQMAARQEQEALYGVYLVAARYVLSASLLILLGFHHLGYPLLELWIGGPKVPDSALHQMADILVIVFAGFALATPGFVTRSVLVAVGEHWRAAWTEISGALIGLGVGLWLMLGTPLGVIGMAVGIALAFVIRGPLLLAVHGAGYFRVPYLRLMAGSFGRPLLVGAAASLSAMGIDALLPDDTGRWSAGILIFAAAVAAWVVGFMWWIIEPTHRQKLWQRLSAGTPSHRD